MTDKQRIKELENELRLIKENPRYTSFLASLTQIKFWDNELAKKPISIRDSSEDDTRLFEKVLKYQMERQKLLNSLEIDRSILLPELTVKAEQEATSAVDVIRKEIAGEFKNNE